MFTNKSTAIIKGFRRNIKGINRKVPLTGKKHSKYIFFDNAASTPALVPVVNELNDYLDWYSAIHRGMGFKSLVSSRIYDQCHDIVARFVNADLSRDVVVMVKNTTEAINKLSYRLQLKPGDMVVSTDMEHHSNDLPWRDRAKLEYARVDEKGKLDINDVEYRLKKNYPRVKLLTVCGASNVTGHINQIHLLARMAHEYGAQILIDGAQLVPHRRFDMKAHSHPGHIDFLAFSGHKIYAPFGCGVLIGPRQTFDSNPPEYAGGGTVKMVMKDQVFWADPPDREEAGSPNVAGAYALARTLNYLHKTGLQVLAKYEDELTSYALAKLEEIPGIKIYGSKPRVGVISFNLEQIPHALVGAVLCFEAGIGVRTGCFCAQNYVRQLLGKEEDYQQVMYYEQQRFDQIPGMVRVSLAAYNTREEVDHLVKWLGYISGNRHEFHRRYQVSPLHNGFVPVDRESLKLISQISDQYMGIR